MAKSQQNICLPLPADINNCIATGESKEQYILNFLEDALPQSDNRSIKEELKKSFILGKVKVKYTEKLKRKQAKRKGEFLSAKKRAVLGLNNAGYSCNLKYSDLLPLNELWTKYMQEMLGYETITNMPKDPSDPNWERVSQQLTKIDFHGAKIYVKRSKCPSLVGKSGIVVQETKNVFRICEESNIIRTIPKHVVEIEFCLSNFKLRVFGIHLCVRSAERAVKKYKQSRIIEL